MSTKKTVARIRHKLAYERGETIVETLVSVLISSLALLMLATAIGASVNIVMQSKAHMERFYQAESEMVANSGANTDPVSTGYTTEVAIRLGGAVGDEGPKTSGSVNVYSTEDGGVSLYKGE